MKKQLRGIGALAEAELGLPPMATAPALEEPYVEPPKQKEGGDRSGLNMKGRLKK